MPADGRFSVPYILVRGPDLGQDRGKAADLRGERTECAQGMTAGDGRGGGAPERQDTPGGGTRAAPRKGAVM